MLPEITVTGKSNRQRLLKGAGGVYKGRFSTDGNSVFHKDAASFCAARNTRKKPDGFSVIRSINQRKGRYGLNKYVWKINYGIYSRNNYVYKAESTKPFAVPTKWEQTNEEDFAACKAALKE